MIGILDYGSGNIFNVYKAIQKIGYDVKIVNSTKNIDKLIIPGVGSFKDGIENLQELKEEIKEFDKPILGICLGMQLLSKKGYEFGEFEGLGLFDGETVKINTHKPLPHLGWNKIEEIRKSQLLKNIDNKEFYFMHSYEVVNYTDSVAITEYEGHKFVSIIEKDNVFAVQFHPEKSRNQGLEVLDNFIKAKI